MQTDGKVHPFQIVDEEQGEVTAVREHQAVQVVEIEAADDATIDKMLSRIHPDPHALITLKEQMEIGFTDRKRIEASTKMKKKLAAMDDNERLKNDIITFKYATDYSFLRRSAPEDVWEAILRREAWRQIPVAMVIVTMVQIGICLVVMIARNTPVNLSTLIMAIMYVIAMATSNPFIITKELNKILVDKLYNKYTQTKTQRMVVHILLVILSPVIFVLLACAYAVTAILDFTTGPILDVSFGSMVNIIVNIIVVFSALSIGLRSQDPINAIQTFVGFDFVNNMDECIIKYVNVDLMAHETRVNKVDVKKAVVRVCVYLATLTVLCGAFYVTISNKCFLFCSGAPSL